jgi:Tfp pilus assembly protein PilF
MSFRIKGLGRGLFLCLLFSLIINTEAAALDKRASCALSHYIMAVMYDSLGDIDKAIAEYKKALKIEGQNAVIHLNLAASYIKHNEADKAVAELNTAIGLDPEAVEPHAILALLYSSQGKSQEASREYEIALQNASKAQPKNIEIYKALGELYLRQKNLQSAEKTYLLILDLAPGDAEAHFFLANIYEEAGEPLKAEKELKRAVELKPDYHEALNYLGYLYVEQDKNLDQAEAMIRKALEFEPDNGAYVDSLGWLYFKKGKLKEALRELEKASLLLEDPVIYDHLGDLYLRTGDKEKAKLSWQKSLKLDPGQDKVRQKLEGSGGAKIEKVEAKVQDK